MSTSSSLTFFHFTDEPVFRDLCQPIHSPQCILPMNLYFDKFFALFTIAIPILIAMFIFSTLGWVLSMSHGRRNKFLQTHLIKPQAVADDNNDAGGDHA